MSLETRKFSKLNETFECAHCGHCVPLAANTCRDHCPRCLHSMHLDINPGDRAANCGGKLTPLSYSLNKKKGYILHFKCDKCGEKRVNRFLDLDSIERDSFEALLKLSSIT